MTPPQTIKEHPSTVPLKIRQLSHNHKVLSSAVTGQRSFIACAQPNDILTMKIDAGGMVPTRKYDKMVFKKKKSQAIAQQVSTTKRTAEKEEDKVKGLAPAVNMGRVKRGLEWDWAQQGKSGADPPKSPMTAWRNRRKQEGEAKEEAYLADLQTTTQNSSARLFAGLTPQDFIPIVLPAHLKALVLEQRRAPPPVVFEEVLSPSAVFLGATPRTDIRLMREAPRCDMGAPRFTPNASLELEKDLSVYEDALLEREGAAAASVAASLVRTLHGGSVEMTRSKDTSIWAVAPAGRRRVSTAATAAHSLTTSRGGASRMSSSSSSSSSRAVTAVGVGTGGSRLGTFDRSVLSRSGEGCGGAKTRMAVARTTGGSAGAGGLEAATSVWSRGSSRSTLGAHPVGSQRSKVCDSSGNSFVDAGPGPHGRFPTVTSPQRLTERNVERGVLWRPGVKDYTFGARTYGEPEELSSSSSSSSSFYGGGGGDRGAFSCLENGSSTAGEGGLDRRKAVTGGSGDENWGGDSLETTLRRRTVRGIVGDVFTDEEGPVPTVPTGWASDGGGGNGGDTTPPAPLTPRGQTTSRLEPLLALASPSPSSPPFASTAASEMPFSPVTVTARHRTRGPAPAAAAAAAADSFFAKSNSFGPHVSAAAFVRNWKRENDIYTPDGPQTSTSKAKSFRG